MVQLPSGYSPSCKEKVRRARRPKWRRISGSLVVGRPSLERRRRFAGLRVSRSCSGTPTGGSCTMKYNPAINEALVRLDGFAQIHPYQPQDTAQGAPRLLYELEEWLKQISGMDRISLQPAAGAHGEWTGLRIIQAYHRDQGEGAQRDTVLVPDSAHGTNPASATLAGLKAVTVKSTDQGLVDLDDYRSKLGPHVAAIMLTNPNTLGLFERDIAEIASLAHAAGALLYYDGANLNAMVGVARPADMGFDVVHLNLHKTFSTPHGGGGPGAGPCGGRDRLSAYLPAPTPQKPPSPAPPH